MIDIVINANPDVFNHNVETVERLSSQIRDKMANFQTSIKVLSYAKSKLKNGMIKSGFMVGLGEAIDEVKQTILVLRNAGVDLITIGQYLQPTKSSVGVTRYVHPDEFKEYETFGLKNKIKIFAGPLVRSSYNAYECLNFNNYVEAE